jgi:hypothetical protein
MAQKAFTSLFKIEVGVKQLLEKFGYNTKTM